MPERNAPRRFPPINQPPVPLSTFERITRLGRGEFHEVWAARDHRTGEVVAIKDYALPQDWEQRHAPQFAYEIMVTLSLNHPNIVRGVGHSADPWALATELVPGQNLREYLKDHGRLDIRNTVRLAAQMADALQHLHQRGIIHRDVQPTNIIIATSGQAKLIDFGAATPFARGTHEATDNNGDIGYVAPERVLDVDGGTAQRGSPQSDLYSLGLVLAEATTREPPARGSGWFETAQWHLRGEMPRLTDVAPGTPKELSDLVAELTARQPEQRPASAAEVAERLRSLLDRPHPAVAPPSSAVHLEQSKRAGSVEGTADLPGPAWLAGLPETSTFTPSPGNASPVHTMRPEGSPGALRHRRADDLELGHGA